MSGRQLLLTFMLVSLLSVIACHKSENGPAATTTTSTTTTSTSAITHDSIIISGCKYAGDIIVFNLYVVAGPFKNGIWDFGDGTTVSNAFNGAHVYSVPGSYTVSFTVDSSRTTRTINIAEFPLGSVYTVAMSGSKHWKGSWEGIVQEFPVPLDFSGVIDTQMTVDIVKAGIIKLPFYQTGLTLNLESEDTVKKMLTFKDCGARTQTLNYYYAIDSIVYTNIWSDGHRWEKLTMHTP